MKGRFAPSPTGRMHLGNIFSALMSWLDVRSEGGSWILRIEDLDPQRSRREYARLIEDDLRWLGLEWDEGGIDGTGPSGPYCQSERGEIYARMLRQLISTGRVYGCTCTRADIMATQAPHQSDGRVIYSGRCRPAEMPCADVCMPAQPHALRLWVPDEEMPFYDRVCGRGSINLARHCGDFVLRRADGAWSYQLAVVADDALMGVSRVVRGNDLLLSAPQQNYLYELLGFPEPEYAHVPLLCNAEGRRLSKRDSSLSMDYLRRHCTPEEIIGRLGYLAGILPEYQPISANALAVYFSWDKVTKSPSIIID